MKKYALIITALLLSLGSVMAQDKMGRISELLDATGLNKEIDQVNEAFSKMFEATDSMAENDPDSKGNTIAQIFTEEFEQEKMRSLFSTEFAKNYNEKFITAIIGKFNTELFEKAKEAEANGKHFISDTGGDPESFNSLPPNRKKLIDGYMKDSRMLELANTMMDSIMKVLIEAMNGFMPQGEKLDKKMIDGMVKEAKDQINSPEAVNAMKGSIAETYADFSDKELKDYFDFYRTPEGKYLMDRLFASTKAIFDIGFKKSMDRIKKEAM